MLNIQKWTKQKSLPHGQCSWNSKSLTLHEMRTETEQNKTGAMCQKDWLGLCLEISWKQWQLSSNLNEWGQKEAFSWFQLVSLYVFMAPKPTCTIHTSLLNFWSLFPITHRMCPFRNSTDTNQYVQSQIHLSLKLDPSPDFSFSIKNSVLRAIAKFIIFSISVLSYPVPWK